jgi:hypothetical protein
MFGFTKMDTANFLNTFCITYNDFVHKNTNTPNFQHFKEKTLTPALDYISTQLSMSIVMCRNPNRQFSRSFRPAYDSDLDTPSDDDDAELTTSTTSLPKKQKTM